MLGRMPRWESGSRERLADAALGLFASQGFERTTVAEIAAAAGLTERTFFRYYGDKREVLFAGQEDFEGLFLTGLAASPATAPMDLVAAALEHAAGFFPDEKRQWSRARQVIIAANPALAEREQHKMSALAATLAGALVERGVEETTAGLAAEAGVSVFRRTFAAWIHPGESRPFATLQRATLARLRALLTP
jgi:AcrR family transcriptional regulator